MLSEIHAVLKVVCAIIIACLATYVGVAFFYLIPLSYIILIVGLSALELLTMISIFLPPGSNFNIPDNDSIDRMLSAAEHMSGRRSQIMNQGGYSFGQNYVDLAGSENRMRARFTPDHTLLKKGGNVTDAAGRNIRQYSQYNLNNDHPFKENKRIDDLIVENFEPLSNSGNSGNSGNSRRDTTSTDLTSVPEEKAAKDGNSEDGNAEDGNTGISLVSEV